eukprot:TRINITY_DN22526_c0_g1_i3.p2 TRINITY_DN22526_c0_g1~~TRINITY_DN22526_c0_g1_i3.p2  ORF type:complete len:125 (+),score=36.66 TRINITY_DN22526_c0_g1_i3:202-576(+)
MPRKNRAKNEEPAASAPPQKLSKAEARRLQQEEQWAAKAAKQAAPEPPAPAEAVEEDSVPARVSDWLEDSCRMMLEFLSQKSGPPTAAELVEAQRRSKELSTTADKVGVKFSGKAFQHTVMQPA